MPTGGRKRNETDNRIDRLLKMIDSCANLVSLQHIVLVLLNLGLKFRDVIGYHIGVSRQVLIIKKYYP